MMNVEQHGCTDHDPKMSDQIITRFDMVNVRQALSHFLLCYVWRNTIRVKYRLSRDITLRSTLPDSIPVNSVRSSAGVS